MSLFSRLLNLHGRPRPLEDFLTEVIAHLFEVDDELCFRWLRQSGVIEEGSEYTGLRVGTQMSFSARDDHNSGSRPDMVLWLERAELAPDIIFVESKVGSTEGDQQLQRYAEHLASTGPAQHRALIYITRDYEKKDEATVLANTVPETIRFHPLRWHNVARLLKEVESYHPNHTLITQLLSFMATHRLDQANRFSPVNALALSQFRQTISFMEEALRSGPAARFEKLLGGRSRDSASLTQLRNHNRYVIFRKYRECYFEVLLGFQIRHGLEYPDIYLYLGVDPNSHFKDMLYDIGKRSDWEWRDLRPETSWVGVARSIPFETILGAENHLDAACEVLNDHLTVLEGIMGDFPNLPWDALPDLTE